MYGKTSPIPVRKKMSKSTVREPVTDRRGDVQLRVEHALEHLAEVGLVLIGLDSQDPIPHTPLLEQLDRQVVEVDLEDRRRRRSASRFLIRFLAAATRARPPADTGR